MYYYAVDYHKEHKCPLCNGTLNQFEPPFLVSKKVMRFRAQCGKCNEILAEDYSLVFKGITDYRN